MDLGRICYCRVDQEMGTERRYIYTRTCRKWSRLGVLRAGQGSEVDFDGKKSGRSVDVDPEPANSHVRALGRT